jgi:hypothetical protein
VHRGGPRAAHRRVQLRPRPHLPHRPAAARHRRVQRVSLARPGRTIGGEKAAEANLGEER